MFVNYAVVFFVSLACIVIELFFTRILNLKTWNHVVYVIIPFAILGYGIGANFYLIFSKRINQISRDVIFTRGLLLMAFLSMLSTLGLVYFPVSMMHIFKFFTSSSGAIMLMLSYTIVLVPFTIIGFLVVYIFSRNATKIHQLYFFDLLGAGLGAILFFPMIYSLEVVRSLFLISFLSLLAACYFFFPKRKGVVVLAGLVLCSLFLLIMREPKNYAIDPSKGWEWIPGNFDKSQYQTVFSKWHPLGRSDIFRIVAEEARTKIAGDNSSTFDINVRPRPEFAYITANFLAGTSGFHLSQEGMSQFNSQVKPFSTPFEVPYLIRHQPKVVIVGTGGGRDVFMAQTHGAQEIVGAEINPGTYQALSPGGVLYEYTNRVYTGPHTKIHNVDGRHLVKTLTPGAYDVIVFTLVDTYSGLSTGAYAYAESYLYTKNAMKDYLRILNDQGMIAMTRWLFKDKPRETLRIHTMALEALREIGAENPWDHIIIGAMKPAGGLVLIKKTPFTEQERQQIYSYFEGFETQIIYPTHPWVQTGQPGSAFDEYAQALKEHKEKQYIHDYLYDISVITDDSPFFYKYYKLRHYNPLAGGYHMIHTGNVIFLTQAFVLMEAIAFVGIFILLPLWVFKRQDMKHLPPKAIWPFVIYFSCLGIGFMFIEIPMMQKFTLLLGSPIYSISVTLAALLIATGLGSSLVSFLKRVFRTEQRLLFYAVLFTFASLIGIEASWGGIVDRFMGASFVHRVIMVVLCLAPVGMGLGIFFPVGLEIIGKDHEQTIPWAWGINCGLSVLGSMLAIIVAQFSGFKMSLGLACFIYIVALWAIQRLCRETVL